MCRSWGFCLAVCRDAQGLLYAAEQVLKMAPARAMVAAFIRR